MALCASSVHILASAKLLKFITRTRSHGVHAEFEKLHPALMHTNAESKVEHAEGYVNPPCMSYVVFHDIKYVATNVFHDAVGEEKVAVGDEP